MSWNVKVLLVVSPVHVLYAAFDLDLRDPRGVRGGQGVRSAEGLPRCCQAVCSPTRTAAARPANARISSMPQARRTSHERLYNEICEGVRAYFNQALPTLLLYKFERRQVTHASVASQPIQQSRRAQRAHACARATWQYRDVKEASRNPAEVYGAEHLLRLFVKL